MWEYTLRLQHMQNSLTGKGEFGHLDKTADGVLGIPYVTRAYDIAKKYEWKFVIRMYTYSLSNNS